MAGSLCGSDLFEAKGELKVQSLRIGDKTWTADGKPERANHPKFAGVSPRRPGVGAHLP